MGITDELMAYIRKHTLRWADPEHPSGGRCAFDPQTSPDMLRDIADRIDAEHERLMRERRGCIHYDQERHYCNVHDLTTDEHYQLLPVDADGVPIHIGDVMDSKVDYLFDGRPFYVRALVLCEDGWDVADGRFGNRYEPNSLRHHHAPTVEDVLREFALTVCKDDALTIREGVVEEFAKRLTLAEGEDA